jgi:glycosyltransferase involved in cell wall biosynthesis
MSKKFSIICVYNDRDVLDEWLLSSLENEDDGLYEKVLVDNRDNEFSSAADALNYGAEKAEGEYYLFVHQDLRLIEDNFLEKLSSLVENLDDLGVAGVAGMAAEGEDSFERGRNIIYHGLDKEKWEWGNSIDSPEPVQTIDEMFILIPSKLFENHQFDGDTCSSWHLYGTEYCLRMLENTEKKPYVLPLRVWHRSNGGWRKDYFETLYKIALKYPKIDEVFTTTGHHRLTRSYAVLRLIDQKVGMKIGYWPSRIPSAVLRRVF